MTPLRDPHEGAALVAALRAQEPDAHHIAWAWRVGEQMRFSDDGEPAGTAGRPMLEIVLKRDLDRLAVLVARVFGGVRLGAGGLVRAYGGSVARALDAATVVQLGDRTRFVLYAPFADADALLRLLQDPRLDLEPARFDSAGLMLTGSVLSSHTDELTRTVAEVSRGRARWSWLGGHQRK